MATRLYVGNLSYSTTDDSLRDAFAKAGTVVSATVVIDKMTGRSRGFGFVEMDTQEAATAAIEMYNDKEIDGRAVKVNEARPMEARRDFGGNRGGFGGGRGGNRGGFGGGRGGNSGGYNQDNGGQDDNNSWS